MSEYLTIEEIHKRFDSEWVLLINPKTDDDLNVLGGEVLAHGKDRHAVHLEAMASGRPRPWSLASVYTGKRSDDMVFIL